MRCYGQSGDVARLGAKSGYQSGFASTFFQENITSFSPFAILISLKNIQIEVFLRRDHLSL